MIRWRGQSFRPNACVVYEHMFGAVSTSPGDARADQGSPEANANGRWADGASRRPALDSSPHDRRPDGVSRAPRGRHSHGDLSRDPASAAPRGRDNHHDMSSVLAKIDQRVVEIEAEIATLAPLVHERARLLRARATILGEPEPDLRRPAWQRRITRGDVFEYLARHPGSRAGEIAAGLGVGQAAVSAHLYRGRGRFFVSRAGRWYPVPAADPSST